MSSVPGARPAPQPLDRTGIDPLRAVWSLLTNVKFALVLVGSAAGAGLLGVVIPQVPGPMRGNPAAREAWMELRRQDFGGAFAGLMDRLQLFDVFYSPWFNGLWALIIVSVTVSTVSRFRPTARSVHRPPRTVPDRYFDQAHHRADYSHPGGASAVEAALRKRRYTVERTAETADGTYLFAQRFSWAAYGTFLSHLALLIFLVGGLLTRYAGFDEVLALAEETPGAPVFAHPGPGQMFVRMIDAHRGMDAQGNIIDYHSDIEVSRAGETLRCTTTVNDPCHAFGYKIHQAAFFDDIARLRVVGPDRTPLFSDNVDFENKTAAVPRMKVTDGAGRVLFDQMVPQFGTEPGSDPGPADDVALGQLVFPVAPGSDTMVSYVVAWRFVEGGMRLVALGRGLEEGRELQPGQDVSIGTGAEAYRLAFSGAVSIPALRIDDMPGAGPGGATIQMAADGEGRPYLFVSGLDDGPVTLRLDGPVTTPSGYSYTFGGQVEASGLNVKRDPGSTFIWVAVAMAIIGLSITFYVPRRRLWVKVSAGRTYFAGIAEKSTRLGRELRQMGAELGSRDALRPEDLREEG